VVEQFFVDKKYWWLRHSIFWAVMYADGIFDLLFFYESSDDIIDLCFNLFWDMVMVYINIYILIPKFLIKKYYTQYLIYTLLSILMVELAHHLFLQSTYTSEEYLEIDIISLMLTSAVISIGTLGIAASIKMTRFFYERQQHLNELKQAQLSSEVNYLKQQTNPHFLFNTLNSIYVLAKQKKENTPSAIMLLSDLMRYQTYDASNEKVPLTKEIEFIENYLELEKLRRDRLEINLEIHGDIQGELIEPLLFLPFIENAVKHSASTEENSEVISINLTNKADLLELTVTNSIGKNTLNSMQRENSGFGLDNIRKRVNLLYPEKHQLHIEESDNEFRIMFVIER